MKKYLFIVALLGLSMSSVHSQILIGLMFGDKLNTPTLEFGMNVGVNYSDLTAVEDSQFKTGLAIGTYFTWKMHDRFYLQPELFFHFTAGAEKLPCYALHDATLDPLLENASITRNLFYFSLPVLLKARLWNELRFSVGPQFSYLSSANDRFLKGDEEETELSYKQSILDTQNRFDIGFSGGMSYKLKQGKGVNLELRYYHGLMNTEAENSADKKTNTIFSLLVGIPIGAEADAVSGSAVGN